MTETATWTITTILLAYFAFTSGVVYEVAGINRTDKLEVPYSIALSARRTGAATVYDSEDLELARWLVYDSNQELPIACDAMGTRALQHYMLTYDRIIHIDRLANTDRCYIFLLTWNVDNGKYTTAIAPGLRETHPLPSLPYNIVKQTGKATVYEKN